MFALSRLLRDTYDPFESFYDSRLPSFMSDDYITPQHVHLNIVRPRRQTSVDSTRQDDSNKYQVMLNVKQFRPEEIDVKTVDNCVVIHGKHEEHADEHGFVSREFTRRYQLPEDILPDTVKSSLSRDGVLTVSAVRKALEPPPANERIVPITIQQPAVVEQAQLQQQQQQAQEKQSPDVEMKD